VEERKALTNIGKWGGENTRTNEKSSTLKKKSPIKISLSHTLEEKRERAGERIVVAGNLSLKDGRPQMEKRIAELEGGGMPRGFMRKKFSNVCARRKIRHIEGGREYHPPCDTSEGAILWGDRC